MPRNSVTSHIAFQSKEFKISKYIMSSMNMNVGFVSNNAKEKIAQQNVAQEIFSAALQNFL